MNFDIRNYIWNIFEICKENHVNINLAIDMLIKNLELRKNRYTGATDIDYRLAFKQWHSLSGCEKMYQKEIGDLIIEVRYDALSSAWLKHDKKEFNSICFKDMTINSART